MTRIIDQLIQSGLTLCQFRPKTKGPLTDDWPDNPITKYDGRSNVGVIHLGQTCAIDIDHYEYAVIAFEAVGIDLVKLLEQGPRITGNPSRAKVFFRLPEGADLKKVSLGWQIPKGKMHTTKSGLINIMELRTGRHQDVIFGTHPDGHTYQGAENLLDIPLIPEQLLFVWQHWAEAKEAMLEACPWYVKPVATVRPNRGVSVGGSNSVINAFNAQFSPFSLLIDQGYTLHGERLLSPNSSTKIPAVKMQQDGKHFWSWGASCPFSDMLPHDAFDVFCYFHADGDRLKAVKLAAGLLGIERQSESNHLQEMGEKIADIMVHKAKKLEQEQDCGLEFNPVMPAYEVKPQATVNPIPPVPVVQFLMDWINQANGKTPIYALTSAALSFCSAMFARRYAFDSRSPINLYLGCYSDSIAQLSSLVSVMQGALDDCTEDAMLRSSAFSGVEYMKKALINSARIYWASTEYCAAISFKQHNSRGYAAVANLIRDIYGGGRLYADADPTAKEQVRAKIYQPALSILALMSKGDFRKLARKEEYDSGLLQYTFLIQGGPDSEKPVFTQENLDSALVEYFKDAKPKLEASGVAPKQTFIGIAPDVNFDSYHAVYKKISDDYPYWHGIPLGWEKIMKRICGILAVAQDLNQPVVTLDIAEWANQWVLYHLYQYMEMMNIVGSDGGDPDIGQRVLEVIHGAGCDGCTSRHIVRYCRPFARLRPAQRDEIIEDLVADKLIKVFSIKNKNTEKYVDCNFFIDNADKKSL